MERMIYYPGFEVANIDWLKFALLYIDTLRPIIPPAGYDYLSERHRVLSGEANLIVSHEPKSEEGYAASVEAVETMERVLQHPGRYRQAFSQGDFLQRWRMPRYQKYTLFDDKYANPWVNFCLDNGLAHQGDEGIVVARDVGFIYMTILAHTIGNAQGISPVTDRVASDRFGLLANIPPEPFGGEIRIAQAVIELQLPANLPDIPLEKVIEFRMRRGFKKRLHAFHAELAKWILDVENATAKGDFFQTRGSVWQDFSDEIVTLGAGAGAAAVGIWLLVDSLSPNPVKYLKEIAVAGGLAVGSVIAVREAWGASQTRMLTRKYLASLGKLQPYGCRAS